MGIRSRVTEFFAREGSISNAVLPDYSTTLSHMFGGGVSSAGVRVTDEAVIGLPAVYAAVRLISSSVAQLPLKLMQHTANGAEVVRGSPLYDLLVTAPNGHQTGYEFLQQMQAWLTIRHNAYALIERQPGGPIRRLLPVHPSFVKTVVDENTDTVHYEVRREGGEVAVYPQESMLHLRGYSDDGFSGLSPVSILRDALGANIAAEKYTHHLLSGGTHLPGYFVAQGVPAEMLPEIRSELAQYRGPERAGETPIFGGVMEWHKIGMTAQEAQILDTRRFQLEDVARMFTIPPHMLGDQTKSSYSSLEQQQQEFVDFCLGPSLANWEARLNVALLSLAERRRGMFWHFERGALVRGDITARFAAHRSAIMAGWLTRNEAREKEDLLALPGLDVPLEPLNMVPAGERR